MVNSHNPIVSRESNKVDRFWSFANGIFVWEFMMTLNYEWRVIRGRRPYRWTIWIYSLTRLATLVTVALNLFSIFVATRYDCQVIVNLQFIFAYLASASASLLIVLRIIAIWDRKRIIVAFATGVWVTSVAFLIQGVIRFRSSYVSNSVYNGCVFNLDSIRLSTVVAFAADINLIFIMLFGLYRLRRHVSTLALGRLLWNQGVAWLLIAVATELTPTVLILLNIDQELNILFQVPWSITMSIAATRMYRSLSNFLSPDDSQKSLPRTALENSSSPTAPILFTGMQVAVDEASKASTPQEDHFGTDITEQQHEKSRELTEGVAGDYDLESGSENSVS